MIKEFILTTWQHFKMFFSDHNFVYIIKSYWCYLIKGYSYCDCWDLDLYILLKLKPMLETFIEQKCGYPCDFKNEEEWTKELRKVQKAISLILLDEFESWSKEQKARKTLLNFLSKRFFQLWW